LNWFHAGTLPVSARQLPTGPIRVDSPARTAGTAVAYCRVSGADQRGELERQAGRVAEECGTRGIALAATITEIGSGVDGNRVTLRKLRPTRVSP
jgi:putative resolvase